MQHIYITKITRLMQKRTRFKTASNQFHIKSKSAIKEVIFNKNSHLTFPNNAQEIKQPKVMRKPNFEKHFNEDFVIF